jgi:hypothetical protein
MKIRCEGRKGRSTARVASMLEMGKFGGWETSATAKVGRRGATAAPRTLRAARIAAGRFWFCHRDIIILRTRRGTARRHSNGAAWRRCHDPGRAAGLCPGRSIRCFLLAIFPRKLPPTDHSREPLAGPTSCPDVVRTGRRPSHDGPGECLAQPTSESTARTRSEFVTPPK